MGPIAAALTGGAIGAAGGGLLGALIGYGIPEDQVRRYETGIREGNIVMGVTPRSGGGCCTGGGEANGSDETLIPIASASNPGSPR
jgi:hypothetical protein